MSAFKSAAFSLISLGILAGAAQADNLGPRYMIDDYGRLVQTYEDDGEFARYCFKRRIAVEDEYGDVTWRWTKDCEGRKLKIRYKRPILTYDPSNEPERRSHDKSDHGQRGDKTPDVR